MTVDQLLNILFLVWHREMSIDEAFDEIDDAIIEDTLGKWLLIKEE